MEYLDLGSIIRKFIVNENNNDPDVFSHIQIVSEIIDRLKSNSLKETRFFNIMKQHMYEIKRKARKLQEQVNLLEEQVKMLEEEKTKKRK